MEEERKVGDKKAVRERIQNKVRRLVEEERKVGDKKKVKERKEGGEE